MDEDDDSETPDDLNDIGPHRIYWNGKYSAEYFELFGRAEFEEERCANASVSDANPTEPFPKKRRQGEVNLPVAPRVLRRDIRRIYANMFCNVMNNAKGDAITNFFKRYARPTTSLIYNGDVTEVSHPTSFLVPGVKNLNIYLTSILVPYPDLVFRLQTAEVIKPLNSRNSQVKFMVNVDATKVFNLSVHKWMPFIKRLKNGKVLGTAQEVGNSEDPSVVEYLQSQNFNSVSENDSTVIPADKALAPSPCKQCVQFKSEVRFDLDEDYSITMFDISTSLESCTTFAMDEMHNYCFHNTK